MVNRKEMGALQYPSMKAGKLLAILLREPLNYEIARSNGSHRTLKSELYPRVIFAFHDGKTISPGLVRKVLEKDVGLTPEQAADILGL